MIKKLFKIKAESKKIWIYATASLYISRLKTEKTPELKSEIKAFINEIKNEYNKSI